MEFIFGYPIWEFKKTDKFNRKKIEQEIYKAKEEDTENKELGIRSTRGGYQSDFSFPPKKFKETLKYICSHLESPEGLRFPHSIEAAWANINQEGDYNIPHNHGSDATGFAGVLFVTDAPGLHILNPRPGAPFYDVEKSPEGNAGEIILFPKSLLHWVEPSKFEKDRITFAFNIDVPDLDRAKKEAFTASNKKSDSK